ncbi:NAD(+) diphosphatase [Pararhodobacter zhoushanensis]|uniref:NAD(+) diphosphatase n=1 Tax=Pararhodobacter zhoushanensis TaxID=2479545 RepID=A0ABT3H4V3_9RHOB|nr:NAD(+) diphosphatase [Pararhodobacter zhoushanensis]MCW1934838.1 NAD(+) diphosphatase [Pararhodobacter zhoushanensis]
MSALLGDSATRILPVWRGRPLISGEAEATAVWLAPGHVVLDDAGADLIFLGTHQGHARFVADVSSWVPAGLDEAAMSGFFDATEYGHPDLPEDHRYADLRGLMARLDPVDAAMAATARGLLNWHRSHRFCSSCGQPSDAAQGGWQRICPACRGVHFPRTDPAVIMLVQHGDTVLLGRSPGWPEGMYSTLAGFVEPGESLEAAVRREVFEETSVRVTRVSYVASQPWPWPSNLMLGFVAEAVSKDITLDHELEDALWITRAELAHVMAGEHPRIRRPRKGAIAQELMARWLAQEIGFAPQTDAED